MTKLNQEITEKEEEAVKFLERDFNQCFQQMRHYGSQILEILKFMFTSYSILISGSDKGVKYCLKLSFFIRE